MSVAPGHGNITSFAETAFTVRSTPLLPERMPESKVFENKGIEKKAKAWWAKGIMKKGRAQKLTFALSLPFLFYFLSPTLCFSTCSFLLSYQRLFVSGPDLTPGNALSDLFTGHLEDKAVEGSVCGSGHLVVNIRSLNSQHHGVGLGA